MQVGLCTSHPSQEAYEVAHKQCRVHFKELGVTTKKQQQLTIEGPILGYPGVSGPFGANVDSLLALKPAEIAEPPFEFSTHIRNISVCASSVACTENCTRAFTQTEQPLWPQRDPEWPHALTA